MSVVSFCCIVRLWHSLSNRESGNGRASGEYLGAFFHVTSKVHASKPKFLFTEDDVDDESLLTSLDITESLNSDEFEEVDNELDAVWDYIM